MGNYRAVYSRIAARRATKINEYARTSERHILYCSIWLPLEPRDFPPKSTVFYYFNQWSQDGTWQSINDALRMQVRVQAGKNPEPSAAIIDSQSVKTTDVGGEHGYDVREKS